jgi:hypothetical protein
MISSQGGAAGAGRTTSGVGNPASAGIVQGGGGGGWDLAGGNATGSFNYPTVPGAPADAETTRVAGYTILRPIFLATSGGGGAGTAVAGPGGDGGHGGIGCGGGGGGSGFSGTEIDGGGGNGGPGLAIVWAW